MSHIFHTDVPAVIEDVAIGVDNGLAGPERVVQVRRDRIEVFSPVATGSFPASCAESHIHPM